jgi:hypothetical protein
MAAIAAALQRPWTDTDGSLASLLQRQAPLIALARKGAMLPRFELGTELNVIAPMTPVSGIPLGAFSGAKLLLLDGRRLLAAGRPAEALDDALTALAIAGQFEREKNFVNADQVLSFHLMSDAFPLLADLIASGLDEPRLVTLRDALQPLADTNGVGQGIQQDLAMVIGIGDAELLLAKARSWPDAFSYIPPPILKRMILDVLRAYKDFADAVADGARRNVPSIQESEIARRRIYGERPNSIENLYFCMKIGMKNPQAYGDCMIAYRFIKSPPPDYSKVIVFNHFGCSRATVLLAAVGVRLYEWSRRMPPQTLQDLVPDFLPKVPVDNFDGFRPLRYVLGPKAWTVYGVGLNRKDDGGVPHREIKDEDWLKPVEVLAQDLPGDIVVTAGRLRWGAAPRRRSHGR